MTMPDLKGLAGSLTERAQQSEGWGKWEVNPTVVLNADAESAYDKLAVDQTSAMADLPVRWVPTTAMMDLKGLSDPLTALDADAHSGGDGSLFGTSDALATSDFLLI